MKNKAKAKTETTAAVENGERSQTAATTPIGEFKVLRRDQVRPDPNQPRKVFDETKLKELAESIRARGIIQPLIVRWVEAELKVREPDMLHALWQAVDGGGAVVFEGDETAVKLFAKFRDEGFHQIVDGECRWRASEIAGLVELPCVIRPMDAKQVFNAQWTSNQQRSNLTALEEGAAFERQIEERKLTDATFNPEKLAEELGIARGTIYNRLKLVRLHGPVRLALEAGTIDPTVAGEISIIPSREDQEEMLQTIRESAQAGQQFSFREVREYIQNNYAKQLADAQFDVKDEDLLEGVDASEGLCYTSCAKCPMRSGNMKEMFPDIKNPHVCTSPKCFAEKHKAHAEKLAAEFREKGSQVITREEYYERIEEFISSGNAMQVGSRFMEIEKIIGKKKLQNYVVRTGTEFNKGPLYLKKDVIKAGEENGLDFTPPKPKPQPKPEPVAKPKSAPTSKPEQGMSEAEREKFLEEQREREEAQEKARQKEEERRRKEHEKEVARQELMERVVKGALQELQVVVEKRPVNGKSESEFWQFLCEQRAFLEQFIFWSSHSTVFERRGLKGEPKKVVGKMEYAEFRSVLLEQFLNGDSPAFDGMGMSDELKQACKFFGVDLKKIEREVADKNRELAGMPEPKEKMSAAERARIKAKATARWAKAKAAKK